MIEINDPNSRFGVHECEVTFGHFHYRNSINVKVGGNCKGLDIIKSAADRAVERVIEEGLDLNAADETLRLSPRDYDWRDLEQMIVRVTILSFKPEEK